MKRKRERSKLANGRDRVKSSDAIVEATSTSPLTVSKQKNTSDDQTTNSDPFPSNLLMEILKRFPVKTLARLTCINHPPPRNQQALNPLEASVTATYLTTHPGDFSAPPSVHGLICYGPPSEITVYNPTTRRRVREDCPPHYSPESLHICIDGVLYYGAYFGTGTTTSVVGKDRGVMSFDVRSEKFDVIRVPQGRARKFTSMTRYYGKLAIIYTVYGKIGLWVLEDAVKHEWSSTFFHLPRLSGYNTKFQVFCAIDDAGEFVLAPKELQASAFYVLYYDPKKMRVRKVDVEGITEHEELPLWDKDWKRRTMSIFPGQVENLMFL
ncbi:hypothetical protein F2Q69_00062838 [Brassica cretica]|uniref:F-box associated beta-propeller type 3 domain-containing protein n=1 Tax=Brassica cretica TaxID=69181 RepID=A0A8S9RNM0_BRACR|nr:hypothetical protein F2Q69_00062838 [Brassica cretica]